MTVYEYTIDERRTFKQWARILKELWYAGDAFYEIYGDLESLIYDEGIVHGEEYDMEYDDVRFVCTCSRSAYEE